jgi:hypothetical protein
MTQKPIQRSIHRGRILPEHKIPPEELARRQAELDARYQRCRPVFERAYFLDSSVLVKGLPNKKISNPFVECAVLPVPIERAARVAHPTIG